MNDKIGSRLTTGIIGLDEILHGGLTPHHSHLICGGPGGGKTILGLHFLLAGIEKGETGLYITLGESEAALKRNASNLGFNLEPLHFLDLTPNSTYFSQVQTYDIFSSADVEREPITQKIIEEVTKLKPDRVFIDPMTQFRYLAKDVFQYRRQVLSFLRFLIELGATVMLASESSAEAPDDDLQFMCDSVLKLDRFATGGRGIAISKFRGGDFQPGRHSLRLTSHGMEVYPLLLPTVLTAPVTPSAISSGIPELDELLGGGLVAGTVTILTGPTGVGKTTLGLQFLTASAGRGLESILYAFEEETEGIVNRCDPINIPIRQMVEHKSLHLARIEPLRWLSAEFAQRVRHDLEKHNIQLVMIDSISGYRRMPGQGDFLNSIHALVKYIQSLGVSVILIAETPNITGDFKVTETAMSYLSDTIIFLRYLEIEGELRKAIGVLKKRAGSFERQLREFEITRYGIKVGNPLTHLRGILRGTPEWVKSATGEP